MAASPTVQVKFGEEGSWAIPTSGINVTPGSTVYIRLENSDEVSQWTLQAFGVDEVTGIAPALSGVDPETHVVSDPTSEVTFTMPAGAGIGRAVIFRSMVNGGGAGLVSNFGIYTLTADGFRVAAVGERFEGDPDFGWATTVNSFIRSGGGGGGGGGLPPVSGEQYAVLMENPGGSPVFARLTQEMILPAFAIASFSKTAPNGGTLLYRRGDSISSITASSTYTSGPPNSASVANAFGGSTTGGDVNPGSWSNLGAYASWGLSGAVQRFGTDLGADPTMTTTLTASKGSLKTASWTVTWTSDLWYGVGAAGALTEGDVKALAGTTLATSRGRTITVSPSNQKVYYAYPKAYGTATFTLNGFPAAFNAPVEIQLTNVNGVTRTYYVYESVNLLTGTNLAFVVT
jgi:hypothetical protein